MYFIHFTGPVLFYFFFLKMCLLIYMRVKKVPYKCKIIFQYQNYTLYVEAFVKFFTLQIHFILFEEIQFFFVK